MTMINVFLWVASIIGMLAGLIILTVALELVFGGHLTWRREVADVQRRACEQQLARDMAKTEELKPRL